MTIQVGVGDSFTNNKEHWVITDVKEKVFVCKNKQTGAIVEFDKNIVRKLMD
jgi:hypothetical protein